METLCRKKRGTGRENTARIMAEFLRREAAGESVSCNAISLALNLGHKSVASFRNRCIRKGLIELSRWPYRDTTSGNGTRDKILAAIEDLEQRGMEVTSANVAKASKLSRDYASRARRELIKAGVVSEARWPSSVKTLAPERIARILHLIREGDPDESVTFSTWISRELGISIPHAWEFRKIMLASGDIDEEDWPVQRSGEEVSLERQANDPTAQEIQERCAQIQATWKRDDWRLRAVGSRRGMEQIPTARLAIAIDGGGL